MSYYRYYKMVGMDVMDIDSVNLMQPIQLGNDRFRIFTDYTTGECGKPKEIGRRFLETLHTSDIYEWVFLRYKLSFSQGGKWE